MTQRGSGSGSAAAPGIMHSCVSGQVAVLAEALAVNLADTGSLASVVAKVISSLLCPSLRVRLDHASLEFVANVSESPLIARGVYNIEIVVHYRRRELATDLLRFGNCEFNPTI